MEKISRQAYLDTVGETLGSCARIVRERWGIEHLTSVNVLHDLTGRSAGQARGATILRLNEAMLRTAGLDPIRQTVAHEYAHLVVQRLYIEAQIAGRFPKRPASHGKSWKSVMRALGFEPDRTHNYTVVNGRKRKRYVYSTQCGREALLTNVKHNRATLGHAVYACSCDKCRGKPLAERKIAFTGKTKTI